MFWNLLSLEKKKMQNEVSAEVKWFKTSSTTIKLIIHFVLITFKHYGNNFHNEIFRNPISERHGAGTSAPVSERNLSKSKGIFYNAKEIKTAQRVEDSINGRKQEDILYLSTKLDGIIYSYYRFSFLGNGFCTWGWNVYRNGLLKLFIYVT